jgi:hypothetical protein
MQRDDNQNYPIKDFYVLLYDIYGGRFSVFSGSWHMYFYNTVIKDRHVEHKCQQFSSDK